MSKLPKIIWKGNMDWDTAFDGKQEWDKDIQSNDVPQNAVVLKRPENIFQGLAPYFFGPILLCFLTVFLKRFLAEESFLDFRFFPYPSCLDFVLDYRYTSYFMPCLIRQRQKYISVLVSNNYELFASRQTR